jgi:hypothetical protein
MLPDENEKVCKGCEIGGADGYGRHTCGTPDGGPAPVPVEGEGEGRTVAIARYDEAAGVLTITPVPPSPIQPVEAPTIREGEEMCYCPFHPDKLLTHYLPPVETAGCETCAKVREITREVSGPQKPVVYAGALGRIAALVHTEETWLAPVETERDLDTLAAVAAYVREVSGIDGSGEGLAATILTRLSDILAARAKGGE